MKIRNKLAALLSTLCMASLLPAPYAYAEQPVDNKITTETISELTNEKPVRFLKLSRKKPEKLLMRKYSGIWPGRCLQHPDHPEKTPSLISTLNRMRDHTDSEPAGRDHRKEHHMPEK